MREITLLFKYHPYLSTTAATWIFNNIVTAFVSSFPAPTKSSGTFYVWWFTFSNTVIGNVKRAQSTAIEKSPNWEDAVEKRISTPAQGPNA